MLRITRWQGIRYEIGFWATAFATAREADLVDRYRVLAYPVIVGRVKRLFKEGVPATLKLLESQSFSSGVVALVYEPDREQSLPYRKKRA